MHPAEYVAVLRRRWWALILCLAVGVGGGIYHTHHTPKQYRATSLSLINIPAARGIEEALAGAQLSGQLLGTYAEVATSRRVADQVVSSLGLPESAAQLQHQVSATTRQGTFIIEIAVVDRDPERAASIADAVAGALTDTVATLEAGKADPIRVQPLEAALVPSAPTSPRPRTDFLLGLLLGLASGVVLMFLLESLDRTIKTPHQAEVALGGIPALGAIPRKRGGLGLVAATDEAGPESEAFRATRTAVHFVDPDRPPRVLLVTSPSVGDGKTSVAANLAIMLAASGERVLLIDADLRRASLSTLFGLEPAVGLSNVIALGESFETAVQTWRDLSVLTAGPAAPNPAELLGSQRMATLLEDVAGLYDIVIVDAPPVLAVTDAVVLSPFVDSVLLVARYGRTTRYAAGECARRLETVGARVSGFVLNGLRHRGVNAYYTEDYAPRARV